MNKPIQVLRNENITKPLFEIIENYDPNTFEKATTLYRKPSYQRTQQRDIAWRVALMDSILENYSIGGFSMSEWTDEKGNTFYNVEDGQTRFGAILSFWKGEIESSYGSFSHPRIRRAIENYQVHIIMQKKAGNHISNDIYFKALQKNFVLLQEGKQLSPYDRYITQFPDPMQHFEGAPLINYTITLVNHTFVHFFEGILRVKMCNRNDVYRKKVHEMISIVSGALFGCEYANNKYYAHLDIMMRVLSEDELNQGIEKLKTVLETITDAIQDYPREKSERLYDLFGKCQKFMGSMFCDLEENPEQNREEFKCIWKWFINTYRRHNNKKDRLWINNHIYRTLNDGEKRNTSVSDYRRRMHCVRAYYEVMKHNEIIHGESVLQDTSRYNNSDWGQFTDIEAEHNV